MKRLLNILICAGVVAFASCMNDRKATDNSSNTPSDEKGVLMLNVSTRTEGESVKRDYTLDIYKNEGDRSFVVRKYDSSNEEMQKPEYIWLLEGNYTAKVVSGSIVGATFTKEKLYFCGETSFDIVGGKTQSVDLIAVMQNIPVEVVFDQTVIDGFHDGYYAEVKADNNTKLQYTESGEGYFIMPKGVTSLTWNFVGTYEYKDGETVDVNSSGTINVELQKRYKLLFKYSKDAPGFLGDIVVSVDEKVEERDDHLSFSPDPELKGDGFSLNEHHNYMGGERKYLVTSIGNINAVNLSVEGRAYDLVAGGVAGVAVAGVGTSQMSIIFSDEFFNSLSGGEQDIEITISDDEGGSTTKPLLYNLQGVNEYERAYTNLWSGVSTLSATVFGEHQSVQIACRKRDAGEWKRVEAVLSGENIYSADIDGIGASSSYEYSLVLDGTTIGASRSFATESGNQIPNSGLEDWVKDGSGVIIPYHTIINPYWCTGNYGTALLSKNITQSSTDVRPGSTGTNSAYMDSEYIVVKFAAGNIYVGSWGGMDGTDAVVYFGQPFEYNAKPKAIRFWAKWTCGTIDKVKGGVGKSGDPDLCKIFCCMATDRHAVDSADADGTTFSPSDANIKSGDARYKKVLYSAYMETTQSQTEWKQIEIPFTFYGSDPNQVPSHLILTFTCSGYGDFFDGSTNSWMYVDDIELVY